MNTQGVHDRLLLGVHIQHFRFWVDDCLILDRQVEEERSGEVGEDALASLDIARIELDLLYVLRQPYLTPLNELSQLHHVSLDIVENVRLLVIEQDLDLLQIASQLFTLVEDTHGYIETSLLQHLVLHEEESIQQIRQNTRYGIDVHIIISILQRQILIKV